MTSTMRMQYKDALLMNTNIDNYTNNKIIDEIMSTKRRHRFHIWSTPFEVEKKYEPIDAIGRGAYGVVCASINTMTGEKVAIKKISNVSVNSVEALKVLRELKILRCARHENIIELKDVMISSSKATFNDIYLVLELMDSDLHSIIQSPQPLSNLHIQYYMFQLLRGLNHLHSANILHRDLKPQNLLVNERCGLKICDFGLSSTNKSQVQPEYVVTRWYRAPEVLLNETHGAPIDVWSVGCILAELLGRRPLFPGRNSYNQMVKIICALGTPSDSDLEFVTNVEILRLIKSLPYTPRISLMSLFPDADIMALDLLQKLLMFDPNKRITVKEALQHPYLAHMAVLHGSDPAPVPCDLDVDSEGGVTKIKKLIWEEMLLYHPETTPFRA